ESGDSGEESDDGLTDEERKRIEDLTGDDSGSDGQEQQDPSGGGEVARAGSAADDAGSDDSTKEPSESASESADEGTQGEGSGDETKVTDATPRPRIDPEKDSSDGQP